MLQQFGGTLAATLMDSKTHAALRQRLRGYLKANPSVTHKQVGLAIGVKSPSVTNFVNAKRGLKASRMEALAEFLKAPTMHSALHRACKVVRVPAFRPYDLRHLFLTTVALATKDDRVVAELGMHADIRQTRRYTMASVNPRLIDGLKAVARQWPAPKVARPGRRVATRRK